MYKLDLQKRLVDFSESLRKIFQDRREAQALRIAKRSFLATLLIDEVFVSEERDKLLDLLKIELFAATTKKDIEKLLSKYAKIMGLEYPE